MMSPCGCCICFKIDWAFIYKGNSYCKKCYQLIKIIENNKGSESEIANAKRLLEERERY